MAIPVLYCPHAARARRTSLCSLLLSSLGRPRTHGLGLERSVAHVEIGFEPVLALRLEQPPFHFGADVAGLIRTPEVSQMASKISALKVVRQRLLELQRALGERGSVVAEGRDIGTVIFPRAEVKIYLDASVEERARRRCEELHRAGREVTLQDTRQEMEERDKRDSERDLAPLRKAQDALAIDSSSLSADAVRERVMIEIWKKKLENK